MLLGEKMGRILGFILSLVSATAATALIDGFVPDGAMKKYVRYLVSLTVLLVLIAPLRDVLGELPSLAAGASGDYESVEALARANSIVAMHIEDSLISKFSLRENEVDVAYDVEGISVRVKRRVGLFASDIELYVMNTYGVEAMVELYE